MMMRVAQLTRQRTFRIVEEKLPDPGPGEVQVRVGAVGLCGSDLHSFAEGAAVGVSFGGGAALAATITLAVAVHNIPEGLAVSAVMRPQGASILSCMWWSFVSSVPQPLAAVPAFLFITRSTALLPYGLGFAAGAMVFMVLVELLPEAYEQAVARSVAVVTSLTLLGMLLVQSFL